MELKKLLQEHTSEEDRRQAYKNISKFLKTCDSEKLATFTSSEGSGRLKRLMTLLCDDVQSDHTETSQLALFTLGSCLYHDQITSLLSIDTEKVILSALCEVIKVTSDKNTCTRALWCIGKQTLRQETLAQMLKPLLVVIELGQCQKNFKSVTVEHEALNAIIRLLERVPAAMATHAAVWAGLIYPLLIHSACVVRERATVAMELAMPLMTSSREQVAANLASDLKALLIQATIDLYKSGHEVTALKVWVYYVRLLDKVLHHGSLINQMLQVVEKGFGHSRTDVKLQAYKCWVALIDNFSLNLDILSDKRRIKLIMQVFRLSNARTEEIARVKLQAWWHLVVRLRHKAALLFDQVCVPMLQFCLTGRVDPSTTLTPSTHRLAKLAKSPFSKSPTTPVLNTSCASLSPGTPATHKSLHVTCLQIIGQLLRQSATSNEMGVTPYEYTIEPLEEDLISFGTFFLKHHSVFVTAVSECFLALGNQLPACLGEHVWSALVSHMRSVLINTAKPDHTDALSCFMTSLQGLVMSQALDGGFVLKLLSHVTTLPHKVLTSQSYQMSGACVLTQASPVLYVTQLLLHHRLVETCITLPQYNHVFSQLITCGMRADMTALTFCHQVITLLAERAGNAEQPDALWELWNCLATELSNLIKRTDEGNEGTDLEPDFSCIDAVLIFPVMHLLEPSLSQSNAKLMVRLWDDLYATLTRLAAMVTVTCSNTTTHLVCAQLVAKATPEKLKSVEVRGVMTQLCDVIMKHVGATSNKQPLQGHARSAGNADSETDTALISHVTQLRDALNSTPSYTQVPLPTIATMTSPRKQFGSFLNKPVSPHVHKSPLKVMTSSDKATPTAKKHLSLNMIDDMSNSAFVPISSEPRRARALTEHQRDVMRAQRGHVPALYCDVTMDADSRLTQGDSNSCVAMAAEDIRITPLISDKAIVKIQPLDFKSYSKNTAKGGKKNKKAGEVKKDETKKGSKPDPVSKKPRVTMTTRRRSVRFSDEIDLETLPSDIDTLPSNHGGTLDILPSNHGGTLDILPSNHSGTLDTSPSNNEKKTANSTNVNNEKSLTIEIHNNDQKDKGLDTSSNSNKDKSKSDNVEMSVGMTTRSSASDSVMIIDSTDDDLETQHVTPIKDIQSGANKSNIEPNKTDDSINVSSSKESNDPNISSKELTDSNGKFKDKATNETDTVLPSKRSTDLKSNSELAKNDSDFSCVADSVTHDTPPRSETPVKRRSTRSHNASVTSPPRGAGVMTSSPRVMTSSGVMASPRRRTPRKKLEKSAAENNHTLDTWLAKSQEKGTGGKIEDKDDKSVDKKAENFKETRRFSILCDDETSPVPAPTKPKVVIMAEDTQQFSPAKHIAMTSSTQHGVIVEEKPQKPDSQITDSSPPTNTSSATAVKNLTLFMSDDVISDVIPDSQQVSPNVNSDQKKTVNMTSVSEFSADTIKELPADSRESGGFGSVPERPFKLFASAGNAGETEPNKETSMDCSELTSVPETQPFSSKFDQSETVLSQGNVSQNKDTYKKIFIKDSGTVVRDSEGFVPPTPVLETTGKTEKDKLHNALAESTPTSQIQGQNNSDLSDNMTSESDNTLTSQTKGNKSKSSIKRRRSTRKSVTSSQSQSSIITDQSASSTETRDSPGPEALKQALAASTQQSSGSEFSQDEDIKSRGRRGRARKSVGNTPSAKHKSRTSAKTSSECRVQIDASKVEVIELSESEATQLTNTKAGNEIIPSATNISNKNTENNTSVGPTVKQDKNSKTFDKPAKTGANKKPNESKKEEDTNRDMFSESDDEIPLISLLKKDDLKRHVAKNTAEDSDDSECFPLVADVTLSGDVTHNTSVTSDENDDVPVTALFAAQKNYNKTTNRTNEDSDTVNNDASDSNAFIIDSNSITEQETDTCSKTKKESEVITVPGTDSELKTVPSTESEVSQVPGTKSEMIQVSGTESEVIADTEQCQSSTTVHKRVHRRKQTSQEVLQRKLAISMKTSPRRRTRSLATPVRFVRATPPGDRLRLKKPTRATSQKLAQKQAESVTELVKEQKLKNKEQSDAKAEVITAKISVGSVKILKSQSSSLEQDAQRDFTAESESESEIRNESTTRNDNTVKDKSNIKLKEKNTEPSCDPDAMPGQIGSDLQSEQQYDLEKVKDSEINLSKTDDNTISDNSTADLTPAKLPIMHLVNRDPMDDDIQSDENVAMETTTSTKLDMSSEDPLAIANSDEIKSNTDDSTVQKTDKTFKSPLKRDVTRGKEAEVTSSMEALHAQAQSKASPMKAGVPLDQPETPTSVSKQLRMSRAFRMLQQSHMSRRPVTSPGLAPSSRRPILKASPAKVANQMTSSARESPPTRSFQPISVPRIYSPSASPSAGILKRRRLDDSVAMDSPSPPNKQRRVSFSKKVQMKVFEKAEQQQNRRPRHARCLAMPPAPPSPLTHAQHATSPATQEQPVDEQMKDMTPEVTLEPATEPLATTQSPLATTTDSLATTQAPITTSAESLTTTQASLATTTQDSLPGGSDVANSAESELDCRAPVCGHLVTCQAPVTCLTPWLTSCTWVRGLEKLLESKGITTVGELSALTEYDVHQLPLRPPKNATLRTALRRFSRDQLAHAQNASELAEVLDSSLDSERGSDSVGDLLDEIRRLDHQHDPSDVISEPANQDAASIADNREINQSQNADKTDSGGNVDKHQGHRGEGQGYVDEVQGQISHRRKVMDASAVLRELVEAPEFEDICFSGLVAAQAQLNEISAVISRALVAKCPLSPGSQS